MSDPITSLLAVLWRTTVSTSLLGVTTLLLLRLSRLRSTRVERLAWLLLLAQGWVLWQYPVTLPAVFETFSPGWTTGPRARRRLRGTGRLALFSRRPVECAGRLVRRRDSCSPSHRLRRTPMTVVLPCIGLHAWRPRGWREECWLPQFPPSVTHGSCGASRRFRPRRRSGQRNGTRCSATPK